MDFFKVIKRRRSIRRFKTEPVAAKDLRRILEAGRLAPSGGNRQPWRFIVIRNSETKRTLAAAANDQGFIADANAIIAILGQSRASSTKLPYRLSSSRIPHIQDPMIAIEHIVLAATALGYGTCWIGAFNEDEVKRILKIPDGVAVIALLPLGVPDESPLPRPRKPFAKIFFKESYGVPLKL